MVVTDLDLRKIRSDRDSFALTGLSIVAEDTMEFVPKGFIEIESGRISAWGEGSVPRNRDCVHCGGLVAIPGFVDAHTHVGDSVAKDAAVGRSIREIVSPSGGLKHKILRETPEADLVSGMRNSVTDMIRSGITTFADFRENGTKGVQLLSRALEGLPIRGEILGRLAEQPFSDEELARNTAHLPESAREELEGILEIAHGISSSSANDLTDCALKEIAVAASSKGKLKAIHVAETEGNLQKSLSRTGSTDVSRVLNYFDPDFLVHMTNATEEDIESVQRRNVPVVCCPRANAILGVGVPPIMRLMWNKHPIALGTDNIMLNSPDMFREMDYLSRVTRAVSRDPAEPEPKEVLRMATINGARALKVESETGSIKINKQADIVLVDAGEPNLSGSRDPIASLVLRASTRNIIAVFFAGRVAYSRPEFGQL
jgi:cytosine/adenosine deaminase-related metal-dependent hydrolase